MAPPQLTDYEEHAVSLPDGKVFVVSRVKPISSTDYIQAPAAIISGSHSRSANSGQTGSSLVGRVINTKVYPSFYSYSEMKSGALFYTSSDATQVNVGTYVGNDVTLASLLVKERVIGIN